MKNLAAGANPIVLRKGMKKATEAAVEAIARMSQPIEGKAQIARVAAISASDDEVGELVSVHVIPPPHAEVDAILPQQQNGVPAQEG